MCITYDYHLNYIVSDEIKIILFLYHHFSTVLEYHSQEVITLLGAVKSRFVFFINTFCPITPIFCVSYIIKGLQLECGKPHSVTAPFELFIIILFP